MARYSVGLVVLCLQLPRIDGIRLGRSTPKFSDFVQQYGRGYEQNSSEYTQREALFMARAKEVDAHNAQGDVSWTAGINHLSDWTEVELKALRGWRGGAVPDGGSMGEEAFASRALPPTSFSWLDNSRYNLTRTTKIYDQGTCGSCWAVGSATALNMHSEISGSHRTFSASELVDCAPNPDDCGGTGGCGGSTAELAMNYVMHNGLATEEAIPLRPSARKCIRIAKEGTMSKTSHELQAAGSRSSPQDGTVGVASGLKGWERLPVNKYLPLLRAVADRGPVAITISADGWNMYQTGIFNSCGLTVNHLVVLIGYGQQGPRKFYLIQNSWGDYWGEKGRIRMQRTDEDQTHCGSDTQPDLGTGCKGGPKSVTVCGPCGILYDNVIPIM